MDYAKDVTIDESALDVEWLQQPKLMLKYSQHAADCMRQLDWEKEKLLSVKAEIDRDIRTNPEKYGLAKLTETVVENTIILNEGYVEQSTNVIQAKYNLDMARAAVTAIDQKKTTLENLVKLFGQQYFAGPKVPRDLSSESRKREELNQKVNDAVKSMRRTR